MPLEERIDIGNIINYFSGVTDVCLNIPTVFEQLDADTIVDLLEKAWNMGEKTWMLQAELLKLINDRSKHGDRAITHVAKELGITRSYAYDLYKIAKDILAKDETLKNLPNLNVSHFVACIRNAKKIVDPVDILKQASDEAWSVVEMKRFINGEKIDRTFETKFYKLTEINVDQEDWVVSDRLCERSSLHRDKKGDFICELKIYNDQK